MVKRGNSPRISRISRILLIDSGKSASVHGMRIDGESYRTIWRHPEREAVVQIIDQRKLPFELLIEDLATVEEVAVAIREMYVRGAGLIGATAGYGMQLAARVAGSWEELVAAGDFLKSTRPTAVNLAWAVERQLGAMRGQAAEAWVEVSGRVADEIADEDADACWRIGEHGLPLIEEIAERKGGGAVNILTHCNAGWLAFVDFGSATSPIYAAHDRGIAVHVWVDETRPRNQGARLTAWELGQHGVPHTVIADNTGGHLMQHGMVDLVITGTDRVSRCGDVANKIGTYLKALAARDNGVPFYVALPSSTIDWELRDGVAEIPIEQRGAEEVREIEGVDGGEVRTVRLTPEGSAVANYAFDVTPARLVTGLVTERGVCKASEEGIIGLFPERK
jgi:methylthioribose-1-phosphate isomerase